MEEALNRAEGDPQPFIIGGGEIYKMGMPFVEKIELTRVHGTFEADTFFPEIPEKDFKLISETEHEKDERHDYCFTYQTFLRK